MLTGLVLADWVWGWLVSFRRPDQPLVNGEEEEPDSRDLSNEHWRRQVINNLAKHVLFSKTFFLGPFRFTLPWHSILIRPVTVSLVRRICVLSLCVLFGGSCSGKRICSQWRVRLRWSVAFRPITGCPGRRAVFLVYQSAGWASFTPRVNWSRIHRAGVELQYQWRWS